jgi:RNA polymerase sigma-70 factor (ECF subfamily)
VKTELEQAWNDVASQLRGYIRARVADHFAAEDILQEVYLKAHKSMGRLDGAANLQGWLFQIAKNAMIDHFRGTKESEPVDEKLPAEELSVEPREVERLKESFSRMISNLPKPYREAVRMADLEGRTQKEVAERLGISVSGAKSRVQRGRQLLKRDLMECCEFEFDRRGAIIDYKPKTKCCLEDGKEVERVDRG